MLAREDIEEKDEIFIKGNEKLDTTGEYYSLRMRAPCEMYANTMQSIACLLYCTFDVRRSCKRLAFSVFALFFLHRCRQDKRQIGYTSLRLCFPILVLHIVLSMLSSIRAFTKDFSRSACGEVSDHQSLIPVSAA